MIQPRTSMHNLPGTAGLTLLLVLAALPGAAQQDALPMGAAGTTFVETFDDGNDGQWTLGNASDGLVPDGGNPGAYLRNSNLETYAPKPRTTVGVASTFHCDWRAIGVTGFALDLKLNSSDYTAQGRPMSLVLRNANGTPADFSDDTVVYQVVQRKFNQQPSWHTYKFRVPTDLETLPRGWGVYPSSPLQGDAAWNAVITHVDEIMVLVGDVNLFYVIQGWDLSLDNPTLLYDPPLERAIAGTRSADDADDLDLAAGPNPFNPRTRLSFSLPRAGYLSLQIHDVSGRVVETLFRGVLAEGEHGFDWRGVDAAGRSMPSGVYFARLTAGDVVQTQKLLLTK